MSTSTASRCRLIAVALLAVSSPAAAGIEPDELGKCRALTDPLVRVACYDALVDAASAAPPAATVPAARAPTPPATGSAGGAEVATEAAAATVQTARSADAEAESQFGAEQPRRTEALTTLVQEVASVTRSPLGELIVTLANGQIWKQVDARRLTLKPGQEVEIRTGVGGSYYLSKTSGSRSLKVRRID